MAQILLELLDLGDESPGLEQALGRFFDRQASFLLEKVA